ncbi:TonB-dependent receptor [Brevundimonas diminuta]|uniref:TonB-dependent receptor n=1 Tax=Brevundimonas TaxID=41275 RepID=UPI0019BE2079|nr:TonB-dependent receptor [Brevundimonas diminuta]MBD3817429.1 TonB-dependent receptor [Brevundimonas diminuta]
MIQRVLMAGSALATMMGAPALAQQVGAPPAPAPTASDEVARVDDIVVTGYRASVAESRDIKRDAAEVVDAIVAEDIGEFPQSNLSEAIQRISGVQIRRDYAGGVGNEISIRGLAPEYTQVTLNGQTAPTDAEDRTFNFNVLPAELFRKVEVYKSPSADMEEGGLGGSISLETIRPLDLRGRRIIGSIEGVYNDMTDKTGPRANLIVGERFGDFAAILGVAWSKQSSASESYDAVRWTRRNLDIDNDKVVDHRDVFVMDLPRYVHEQQDVERTAITLAAEYQASDDLRIALNGLFVDNRRQQDRLTPIWFFDGGKTITDAVIVDGVAERLGYQSVVHKSENNTSDNQTRTYQLGLSADYRLGDWKISPFVNYARTRRDSEDFRYYGVVTAPATYDVQQDDDYFTLTTPIDIADPNAYKMDEARHTQVFTIDEEKGGGFDARGDVADGLKLSFGLKYRDKSRTRERFYARRTKINQPFAPAAAVFDGFLDGVDRAANGPHAFVYSDFDKANQLYGQYLDLSTAEEPQNYFDVREQVTAGYLKASLDHGPWKANIGVRAIDTRVHSQGSELDEASGELTDHSVKSSYQDFLPSLNVRYELAPQLFLRGAAARVMSRPSLTDLAAYRVIDEEDLTITAKNPDLDPFRANQFDLAAEWYFAPEALLSVGYFYKDVESFIATRSRLIEFRGETYTIRQPVNGNDARVSGFEVNYQQPFTFLPGVLRHFGVVANYTYTDSDYRETTEGGELSYELPENSRHSYNLIGYYEDRRLSVRVAYNYRGKFLREVPNVQDGLKYRDAYAQTDIALRYKLLDNVSATVDVLNAFNAKTEEYVYQERLTDGLFQTGRTVFFGLKASF